MQTTRDRNALARKLLVHRDAKRDLAAGADQDDVGPSVRRIGEDIGAARETRRRRIAACGRAWASGWRDRIRQAGSRRSGQHDAPGFGDLVGVGRPQA